MTRVTLDYLEGLPAPETFINALGRGTVNEFASEQVRRALANTRTDSQGRQYIDPLGLISRPTLADLATKPGVSDDVDLVEFYALSAMSSRNRGLDGFLSPGNLAVRRAITLRVHDLMEQRPELLHPNLRVAKSVANEDDVWMLPFLVENSVALDPKRLQRMASTPGRARETLQKAIQLGKQCATTLLEEALKPERGCTSTATALLLADTQPPELDNAQVQQLWTVCAVGVAGTQWQFDQAMELLRAIRQRQDEVGGDGHRASWPQGRELLETMDFSWASARGAHPTLGLVYETTLRSAYIGDLRNSDVAGFPGDPLEMACAALNAVLEPEVRLELAELSSQNLAKLTVLCPRASRSAAVQNFWRRDPAGWNVNNPRDVLDWVATRVDSSGESLGLEFLESRANDFSDVLNPSHFNAVLAKVTDRVMNRAILATSVRDDAAGAAPRSRRRARMV